VGWGKRGMAVAVKSNDSSRRISLAKAVWGGGGAEESEPGTRNKLIKGALDSGGARGVGDLNDGH
jgi:hypothetical protein